MQRAEKNDLSTHATTRIHSHTVGIRRLLLLFILLGVSFGLALWLQPAQAATSAYNERVPSVPAISQSPISSPLASGAPDPAAFTLLTELRPDVIDFVIALGQLRAEQLSSFLSGSFLSSLPLSGLRVGPPPVFTQPNRNPSAQSPALIDQHAVYLPLIQISPPAAPASPPPPPPFSCKNPSSTYHIQCQALLAFYASTQGDYWTKNDGWLQDNNPCVWYGVTCQAGVGVVSLVLSNNGLFGHLPPEIGVLPLRKLDVSNNSLMGPLPDELREIASLQEVSIHSNRIRGSYPLGFLRLHDTTRGRQERSREFKTNRFHHIDTSGYRCDGQGISISDCEALVAFFRSTGGENPNSVYWSHYDGRWLTEPNPCNWGGFTCENGRVTRLEFLNFTSLRLTGSLPADIGRLSNLRFLIIRDNSLSGGLPVELGHLEKLEELDLAGNQLTGPLPSSLGRLKEIRRIDLSRNNLSGVVPDAISSEHTAGLHTLALSGNPNLCVPSTLNPFVANLRYFSGNSCQPNAR